MGAVVGLSMSKVKSRGADSNLRLANYECAVWGCWALLGFAKPACLKGFQFCRLPTIAEYCVRVRVKLESSGVSFPCAHEPTSPRFRRCASIPPANRLDPRRSAPSDRAVHMPRRGSQPDRTAGKRARRQRNRLRLCHRRRTHNDPVNPRKCQLRGRCLSRNPHFCQDLVGALH
jgi:hypothetical protein